MHQVFRLQRFFREKNSIEKLAGKRQAEKRQTDNKGSVKIDPKSENRREKIKKIPVAPDLDMKKNMCRPTE